jgi:hypothetical protein
MPQTGPARSLCFSLLACLGVTTPALGDSAPLMGEGEIGMRNCTNVALTLTFATEAGERGIDYLLRGGANTLLRYCPSRCLVSVATPGRGLSQLRVTPQTRYVVDIGSDFTGKFWRLRQAPETDPCRF